MQTAIEETNNSMEVALRQPAAALFAGKPQDVIKSATEAATALKDVVKRQGLISNIAGKEYPRCEAWTLLGSMVGVFPVLCWTKQVQDGWEARVEARTITGAVIGAAEAQCLHTETNWNDREDFAVRSMAQTRATAKALRMPLGFVMTLAGYEATPAEEMSYESGKRQPQQRRNQNEAPQGQVSKEDVTFVSYKKVDSKPPGKWTAWFCTFETDSASQFEAGTFDAKLAEKLDTLVGTVVTITHRPGKKENTRELVSVEPEDNLP